MTGLYIRKLCGRVILFVPLVLILILFAGGCEKEYVSSALTKGVIDGRFGSGGYPDIVFSRSIVPEEEGTLSDVMINWGKVTIDDGEREVVLTGRMDSSRIPPFYYYTFDMKGEPGKTYTLKASFRDISVESVSRMPYPVPIDSIIFSPTESDSLRSAVLYFTAPDEVPSYFYISMREPGRGDNPCMLGCIRTNRAGEKCSLPVLRPKQKIDSVKYVPHLKIDDVVTVSLNRVEKEVYDYWSSYDNMVMFSSSPFISTNESLPSNIEGGFGIWSPQGTSSLTIVVK